MEVSAKNISKRSFFKLLFQSIGYGLMSFTLLMGILAIFGFETIKWNHEAVTGISGFLVSIPLGLLIGLLFTLFMWLLGILGLWVNSYFGGVTIVFKNATTTESE
ncbi:hypothetical protein [Shewanella algidipiscicola]|uniref:DUF3566 domain-containing protein n=1 Tax=Shewanella algidipiscicola TaxID=614070 RepID=A0ABQ4NSK2_9GAMM|nr:hypothetical protein [Shewanella algidipiscicola]GIU02169.1 hypothetical protein TUM4630_32940 [Shewanella algidipiscicola]